MEQNKHLDTLTEIRSLMERSSKFISLSGLSGVFAGLYAIAGAVAAYLYLGANYNLRNYYEFSLSETGGTNYDFYTFFFIDACIVLILSIGTGIFLTTRQARKKGQTIWDSTAQRLIINLTIPLVAGGFFCLALLYHGLIGLVAPATLLFYGLGLINGSKYTLHDIRYLGISEIVLGIIASFFIGYGLLFWVVGFGVLHIVYGGIMYFKYDR